MMRTHYEKVFNRMRRPVLLVAVAIVASLLASGVAVAVTSTEYGGTIEDVGVARSTDLFTTSESAEIPNATVKVTVPPGELGLILARYSAESKCSGAKWCSVRIRIIHPGGAIREMAPAAGLDFAFDSPSAFPNDSPESHSMDRSVVVGPGTYTVRTQAVIVGGVGGASFTLDDWSLTVERAPTHDID
jgi:hypothetical protein